MPSLNVCVFVGHVGQEPEMKTSANGKAMCRFSVATSEGKGKPPSWHTIIVWGDLAELCGKYIYKGMLVAVTGRASVSKWKDQQGNDRKSVEYIASTVQFLSRREEQQKVTESMDDDDVQF